MAALALLCGASACAKQAATSNARQLERAALRAPASANDGARVYITNCSSCHQLDGRGVPGAFPPLASNPFVVGAAPPVIAVVKLGRSGKTFVNGEAYNGTMPHWGQIISDDDIAAVVSYIRSSWRNRASAVSVADVDAVTQ